MSRESRLFGAVREAEDPLTKLLVDIQFDKGMTKGDALAHQACGFASEVLRTHLARQRFNLRTVHSPQEHHVLLHGEEEAVDPTYLQFLGRIGLAPELLQLPTTREALCRTYPTDKIGVFRLDEAVSFGEKVAKTAQRLKPTAMELIDETKRLLDDVDRVNFEHDLAYRATLLGASEQQIESSFSSIWLPSKYYQPFSVEERASRMCVDPDELRDEYEALADLMS